MFQQEVEEVFFLQADWCLHCCVMVGGDHWCAFKSGEATQDERCAEANSLSISSFYPTQESFGSQADASIFSSFHATHNPSSQASSSMNAQKQWFLLLLGPCISDISLHLGQKTKAWICTTSIPSWTHWFLRFVLRVLLRGVTSLSSNPGVWDLAH